MSPPWTPENSHPWSSLEGETKNDSNLWSFGKYCLLLFLPALLKNFPWVTVTLGNGIYCMWMKLLSLLVRVPKTNCWIKATDGKCVSESYVSSHKCHCDFGTVKTHSFPIRITDVEVILSLQILENCLMLKHVGSGPPGNPYWGNIIIFFFPQRRTRTLVEHKGVWQVFSYTRSLKSRYMGRPQHFRYGSHPVLGVQWLNHSYKGLAASLWSTCYWSTTKEAEG